MAAKEEEEQIDRQEKELERVQEFLKPHVDRLQQNYIQSVNRLWLGNAGAALATLSFIGASGSQSPSIRSFMLIPLFFFVVGLIALGCGQLVGLIKDAKVVKRNQSANSIWGIYVSDAETPLEKSGVTVAAKTILQISSAISFALGLASGFILLFCALTR